MDKQQNELIKSYVRARNLGADSVEYEDYELEKEFLKKYNPKPNPNGYSGDYRANLINNNIGEDKYSYVGSFNLANKTIALAFKKNIEDTAKSIVFVDENGNPSIDGISDYEIKNNFSNESLAAYINQKYNINKFVGVSVIGMNNYKIAYDTHNNYFINDVGEISLDNVNMMDNDMEKYKITYLNTKSFLDGFNYQKLYSNNFVFAHYKNGKNKVLSLYGEPIILSDDEIDDMWSHEKAIYYNGILNTDKFSEISTFKYQNNQVASARLINKDVIYINRKGEIVNKPIKKSSKNN